VKRKPHAEELDSSESSRNNIGRCEAEAHITFDRREVLTTGCSVFRVVRHERFDTTKVLGVGEFARNNRDKDVDSLCTIRCIAEQRLIHIT